MARGTVVNEPVVSQANTAAFRDGYDRSGLGTSPSAKEKGPFVWDPKQGKLVRPWEYDFGNTNRAISAPISVDRHYEGVRSPIDGTVFQSRRQHRTYMKARGLCTTDDFDKPGGYWDRMDAAKKKGLAASPETKRQRRDRIGRRLYEISKKDQKTYDREARDVLLRRAKRGRHTPTE